MKKDTHFQKMVLVKNKQIRMNLIILVLSNILVSTLTGAFPISKNTTTGDVTKGMMNTSVFPVTPSIRAALEMKSDRSTTSAANGKTELTTRSKSVSDNPTNFKALKDTTAKIKTPPSTKLVSEVHCKSFGRTSQMSSKTMERMSAASTTGVFSSKVMLTKKSSASTTATVQPSPTYKPVTLGEQNIPSREELNVLAVVGRKTLSVTAQYDNSLSKNIRSPSHKVTGKTTGFVTKTTTLPSSFRSIATSTHSTNGIPITRGTMSGSVLHTSVNVPTTITNTHVTHNPSSNVSRALYKPTNSNKNTPETVSTSSSNLQRHSGKVSNNLSSLTHQATSAKSLKLGFETDPSETVPGINNKGTNAGVIDTKTSNNPHTLRSLTTISQNPPKEKCSSITSKSLLSLGDKKIVLPAEKNTVSPSELSLKTVALGTKTEDTLKSTTPTTIRYTTSVSQNDYYTKSQTQVTTERMHSPEVINRSIILGTEKPGNEMKASSLHFSSILMLLAATATPLKEKGGSSAEIENVREYGYKKTTASEIPALFPSIKSEQERKSNEVFNSSPIPKEEKNERDPTVNSTQVESWRQGFIGVLRTMFEHHKGNSNIIIVPINIINNSGNVYLMDKNQGSQFSLGETVNNKSQVHSSTKGLADSEDADVTTSSFALTHISTPSPNYISEKSNKLRVSEVLESDEKPVIQSPKNEVDEEQVIDSMKFVSRRVPDTHSKRIESLTKAEPTVVELKESSMEENIKSVNSVPQRHVGSVSVPNWRISDRLHESDADDSESTESRKQANSLIMRKGVAKMVPTRMKSTAKENLPVRAGEMDYEYGSEEHLEAPRKDTEYLTHTFGETKNHKQKSQDRKDSSIMDEEIFRPYNRITEPKERRWDYGNVAAPLRRPYGDSYGNYREETQ